MTEEPEGRGRVPAPQETSPVFEYPKTVANMRVHAVLPHDRDARSAARHDDGAETSTHPDHGKRPAPPPRSTTAQPKQLPPAQPTQNLGDMLFGHSPTPLPAPTSPRRTRSLSMPGRRTATVAAALTLAVAAGAGLTWALQRDKTPTITLHPVQGWTQRTTWVSEPLARDTDGNVLPVGEVVATALEEDGTTQVAALDPDTGATVWNEELEEPLTGPLQATGPRRSSLAATTAHSLTIWASPRSAKSRTWTFTEADVKPVAGSPVPLLANPDTATALTVHDGKLVRRTLPSGSRAVAALPTGEVLAVSEAGHWWPVAEKRGNATLLQPPTYGAQVKNIAGVVGTTLLVTWTNGSTGTSVAGYDVDDDMAPAWHLQTVPGDTTRLTTSPDGTWAILGTVALDVASGKPTYLPKNWKTLRMTNDAAWSREHVAPKLDAARTLDSPVKDPATVPVATTRAGRGLIVHSTDEEARIFAVEPDPDHAYDDGDQAVAKPPATPKPKETTKAKETRPTSNKRTTKTTRRKAGATKGTTK